MESKLIPNPLQEGHYEARRVRGRCRRLGLPREVIEAKGPVAAETILVEAEAGHHLGLERRAHLEVDRRRLDDGQQGEPRQQRILLHTPARSSAHEVSSILSEITKLGMVL